MTHARTCNSALLNLIGVFFFISVVRMDVLVCLVVGHGCVWCLCCCNVIRGGGVLLLIMVAFGGTSLEWK